MQRCAKLERMRMSAKDCKCKCAKKRHLICEKERKRALLRKTCKQPRFGTPNKIAERQRGTAQRGTTSKIFLGVFRGFWEVFRIEFLIQKGLKSAQNFWGVLGTNPLLSVTPVSSPNNKARTWRSGSCGMFSPHEWHPSQKGVLDPPRTVRFPTPSGVSALFFLYKNARRSRTEALLEGSKNFWESVFSGTFSSPQTFCTPPYHGPMFWMHSAQGRRRTCPPRSARTTHTGGGLCAAWLETMQHTLRGFWGFP